MSQPIVDRLVTYCCKLELSNIHHNLVSRADVVNILQKHVAASLGPLIIFDSLGGRRYVDIGSGAGFPGLVLKIWDPGTNCVLIEGSRKKCVFMDAVGRELRLDGLKVIQARAETVVEQGALVGTFDLLTSRAVADLGHTLRVFAALVCEGGQILAYKGPRWVEEVRGAREAGLIDSGAFALEQVVEIPWAPGHMVLIRKRTPDR